MNDTHMITCTINDYLNILSVKKTTITHPNDSKYYVPSTNIEILKYILTPRSFICGIKTNNCLVAFSTVFYSNGIYHIEDTVVLRRYRGNGFQKKMWMFIYETIPKNHTLVCTIHPKNKYSLNNAKQLGFRIIKHCVMYNDCERYVLELTKR